MRKIFFFILLILLSNCSKPKTVFICGDHVCINRGEAKQYFEENLTIEVKILNPKKEKEVDLVELNLNKENKESKRKVTLFSKKNTNKDLRTLSKDEIIKIKRNIKNKKNEKKITQSIVKKNISNNNKKKEVLINNENIEKNDNVNKKRKKIVDVCTILEKCSIDEISKYLLKQGEKKGFPDITSRQ